MVQSVGFLRARPRSFGRGCTCKASWPVPGPSREQPWAVGYLADAPATSQTSSHRLSTHNELQSAARTESTTGKTGPRDPVLLVRCGRCPANGASSWYNNAPMESFFGTLKSELVYHCVYHARNEAKSNVFLYIESFYNRRRRHSALDYLSPEAYEQLYHQQERIFVQLPVHQTGGGSFYTCHTTQPQAEHTQCALAPSEHPASIVGHGKGTK